jgi:hypothetical protein
MSNVPKFIADLLGIDTQSFDRRFHARAHELVQELVTYLSRAGALAMVAEEKLGQRDKHAVEVLAQVAALMALSQKLQELNLANGLKPETLKMVHSMVEHLKDSTQFGSVGLEDGKAKTFTKATILH